VTLADRGDGPALASAIAFLNSHVNLETAPFRRATPTLDRMTGLCALLGDPQLAYPAIHLTGTNGKGSTARMITALIGAHGLHVGTYTSPHLERLNERMTWDGEPICDDDLASGLLTLAPLERHLDVALTHFEILTATALAWFADVAVDVAVVEVGLGGRWDSTNIVDGAVAVVTNVGLDHAEVIGPSRSDIAEEKAGIVKPGSILVLGETDRAVTGPFYARGAAEVWARNEDFGCARNRVAHGGRVVDLRTPAGSYDDVFVALHGPHQGDNAACALAAVEAFFGRPLEPDLVSEALAKVRVPGRFELMRRHPLVVLDGAHNPDGARALGRTLREDLAGRVPDVVLAGFTAGRDPTEMLEALGVDGVGLLVACKPPSPRGQEAASVAAAARSLGLDAESADSVGAGLARALGRAGEDGFLLVTGSLYVVGEARSRLH
jgi:dihydrofolate synthase/folylpolyglutamate synthase